MLRFLFKTHRALVVLAFLALTTLSSLATASLSVPTPTDKTGQRAEAIATLASLVKNEPRTLTIGDQVFPFFDGPLKPPGSLAQNMTLHEMQAVGNDRREYPEYIGKLAYSQAAIGKLTSMEAVASLYDLALASKALPKPISSDIRDANFGRQRLTVSAMALRQVKSHEYAHTKFELRNCKLRQICGSGLKWQNIREKGALFVEDFSMIAQWNDPAAPHKYIPNVIGFFCYNHETKQLLPVEIHFPDTGLAYSSLDTPDEWTLAKMGLNAASGDYHQFQHYVETHAVNVGIRVETYRNLAGNHPLGVLLLHHMPVDFGLELLLSSVLLSPGTAMDSTFGMGATGAARFCASRIAAGATYALDIPDDIVARGLDSIPTHQYATYGMKLHTVISDFVQSYVNVFYETDTAVADDFELQNWARACSEVPYLKGFPSTVTTQRGLHALLTSVVYRSMVKHHAMNGEVSWHAVSAPYAPTALWHPLPTQKQSSPHSEPLHLTDFMTPLALLHVAMALPALFYRPPMANQTVLESYRVAPFIGEPRLEDAIEKYESAMADVETFITEAEANEELPYLVLRPSHLPFTTWI